MLHTKTLKLQERFAYRNENTNPKIQEPIKNAENINLLSLQKETPKFEPNQTETTAENSQRERESTFRLSSNQSQETLKIQDSLHL